MNFRIPTDRLGGLLAGALLILSPVLPGCETDSYMDPSRTGYFETTPTAIPILNRIDVIEQDSDAPEMTQPTPEDLEPTPQEYRLSPGDAVRVSIPRLISADQTDISDRVVDQVGAITLPIIGRMIVKDRTIPEVQKDIEVKLKDVLENPKAFVEVVNGRAFEYRVIGAVNQPGMYAMEKPNITVLDALAQAQGASPNTTRILITRKLAPAAKTAQPKSAEPTQTAPQGESTTPPRPTDAAQPAVERPASATSIDDLVRELDQSMQDVGAAGAKADPTPPAEPQGGQPPASPEPPAAEPAKPQARMGMISPLLRQAPPVDIDGLEPPSADRAGQAEPAQADVAETADFIWDAASKQYIRVGSAARSEAPAAATEGSAEIPGLATGDKARARAAAREQQRKANLNRVIEVDYNKLVRGSAELNVIVKPEDVLYCDTGEVGVVYIGGEISRPGVYNLPTSGKLTLSRLVDAAGGLSQIAIPERVDLIRRLAGDREACVRVNLAAIRNRAEPDIFMRPDDHVIIGTNFWATPLAVIRNGFRMTYGFGFLVDRNWGNDIFGAPPVNVVGQ
jgi:polysaccharide export outer membrane protein